MYGDHENAVDALQILGIATRDYEYDPSRPDFVRLGLEPWAVDLALSRRRNADPFTKHEVSDIERCTRDVMHRETCGYPGRQFEAATIGGKQQQTIAFQQRHCLRYQILVVTLDIEGLLHLAGIGKRRRVEKDQVKILL